MSEILTRKARRRFSLVQKYEAGELSLPDFCKAHRIPRSTLCYWRRKFKRKAVPEPKEAVSSTLPRFVRLDTKAFLPSAGHPGYYELCFPDGRVLRMPPELSAETVLSLLTGSAG